MNRVIHIAKVSISFIIIFTLTQITTNQSFAQQAPTSEQLFQRLANNLNSNRFSVLKLETDIMNGQFGSASSQVQTVTPYQAVQGARAAVTACKWVWDVVVKIWVCHEVIEDVSSHFAQIWPPDPQQPPPQPGSVIEQVQQSSGNIEFPPDNTYVYNGSAATTYIFPYYTDPQEVVLFKDWVLEGKSIFHQLVSEAIAPQNVLTQIYIPNFLGGTLLTATRAFSGSALDKQGNP